MGFPQGCVEAGVFGARGTSRSVLSLLASECIVFFGLLQFGPALALWVQWQLTVKLSTWQVSGGIRRIAGPEDGGKPFWQLRVGRLAASRFGAGGI